MYRPAAALWLVRPRLALIMAARVRSSCMQAVDGTMGRSRPSGGVAGLHGQD